MSYHILIADDAALNRILVKKILSENLEDLIFYEAVNGIEVMNIINKEPIDLIILDLIMPEMDGFETLDKLKRHSQYQSIPVIVSSSINNIQSIEETLKAGAIDYFIKPLSKDDMSIFLPLKAKNALLIHEQNQTIQDLNRHIQDELKNANDFANIMLPKSDKFNTVNLYIKYQPSLGIGGDFFDCVEKDGKVFFMVADVTGHGIAAGMASSMVKILFRKSIDQKMSAPHEILESMNSAIFDYFDFAGSDNYLVFTAFLGIIDGHTLNYANAGHPYPIIYRGEQNTIEGINQNGFIVGMIEDVSFESESVNLNKGDCIFLYTDGLFSTGEASDFTGWTEVFEIVEKIKYVIEKAPDDFLDEILYVFHMIHKSRKTHYTDDVAMMLIEMKS